MIHRRMLALCLLLALLLSTLAVVASAAPSESVDSSTETSSDPEAGSDSRPTQGNPPVLMKYTVSKSSITKGTKLTITVSVKHTDVTLQQIGGKDNLDITKLVDSFTDGTISVQVTSGDTDKLTYDVTFTDVTYTGFGKTLRFLSGYKDSNEAFSTMELTIVEAVEYEPPQKVPTIPDPPEPSPPPLVLISRNELKDPIAPGQELDIAVTFQNLDKKKLTSPVAVFTPSDSLMLTGGSSSFRLEDIPGGKSQTITIRVKATDTIAAAAQSLNVELKFNYYNNVATTQGSATERITIPAVVKNTEKHSMPPVIVTRSAVAAISARQEFPVVLTVKNAGDVAMENTVASVTTSDALILQNDTSTFVIGALAPGKTTTISLKLKAGKELTSSTQSISVELKFSYNSGEELAQGSATERINLAANTTETAAAAIDSSVPNIVVSDYTYGASSVASGGSFPLAFTLLNTGKLPVENMVVTVDGGDSFTIDGSSNTFYYSRIAASGKEQQMVQMQALNTARTGAQSIGITCKYEYVDGNKRATATAEVRLSVPVIQPDRFQVNAPAAPEMAVAGEEISLSLTYVNKGKAEVSNVEAVLEGDVDSPAKTQYLGNFDPGKSGNIGFVFTPQMPGTVELTLKINYEDANQMVHTKTFPLTLEVQDPPEELPEDFEPMDAEEEGGIGVWPFLLGGAGLAGLIIVLRIRHKKKHAALAAASSDADWEQWDEVADAAGDASDEAARKE